MSEGKTLEDYTRADMYSPDGAHVTEDSLRWILQMNGTGCVTTHHVFDLVVEVMACRADLKAARRDKAYLHEQITELQDRLIEVGLE